MFEIFRRHQRFTVAALGVVAMLSFMVFPLMEQYFSQSNQPRDDVARTVRFSGGSITPEKMTSFQHQHGRTVAFLGRVASLVLSRGGSPKVPGFIADSQGNIYRVGIETVSGRDAEAHAVQTILLAHEARRQGLEIQDETIDQWLKLYTDNKVTRQEFNDALREVSENQMGRNQLYSQLKQELMADLMLRLGNVGLAGRGIFAPGGPAVITTPATTWKNYLKLNQTATVSVYPVLVEDYLEQAPTDFRESEISALFEKGKDRLTYNDSPEPGFRRRYATDLEYVYAPLDDFVQEAKSAITEEAIRAEYDRRVAAGVYIIPATTETPPATPAQENKPADESKPASEESKPAEEPKPATEEPKPATEEPKPATEEPKPAAEEPKPATEEPKPATSEGENPPAESPATPSENPQSGINPDAASRLVALQEPAAAGTEEAKPETPAAPAEGGKPDTPAAPAEDAKPETPATPAEGAKPAESAPPATPPADGATPPADPAAPPPAGTPAPPTDLPPATDAAAAPPAEKKVRPFEEVKEEIAMSLARGPAREARQKALHAVRDVMQKYFLKHATYQAELKAGKSVEKPEAPDIKSLAEQHKLRYEHPGMVTVMDVQDRTIAQAFVGEIFARGQSFMDLAFNKDSPLFIPQEVNNFFSDESFVFWKRDAREGYVPTLAEARDEVIAALRRQKARELATEAAIKLQEQASKSDKKLQDLVPETRRNLVQENVGPFSWMQSMQMNQRPQVSNLPMLDRVGEKFMQGVFETDVGGWNTAPNIVESVVYLIHVDAKAPDIASLRESFLRATDRAPTQPLADSSLAAMRDSWMTDLEEKLGLEVPTN